MYDVASQKKEPATALHSFEERLAGIVLSRAGATGFVSLGVAPEEAMRAILAMKPSNSALQQVLPTSTLPRRAVGTHRGQPVSRVTRATLHDIDDIISHSSLNIDDVALFVDWQRQCVVGAVQFKLLHHGFSDAGFAALLPLRLVLREVPRPLTLQKPR